MQNKLIFLLLIIFSTKLTYANYTPVKKSNVLQQPSDTIKSKQKEKRKYFTKRLSSTPPLIDGKLNDDCWKTGTWAGDFKQLVPLEGAKPSQKTEFQILYDDKFLYVAARAYDNEPQKMKKKSAPRDEFVGDMMGIDLDSYHDQRTGFEFNVTSAGQKIDLILTNPMNADFSWDAVYYVKTHFEDSAWTAEWAIPFSQLRYSSEKEQVWGIHFWRWIERIQEENDFTQLSFNSPGALYDFGELHGLSNLPKTRRLEILPYTVVKANTFKKEPENPFEKKGFTSKITAGFDAKIGLSSNFTMNLTVLPDFGQVEADPSVMNLTAFETFYQEKRTFFLEGKNIFQFDFAGDYLFYSRRIGHSPSYTPDIPDDNYMKMPENASIISALKISGKTAKGFSLGILQSLTSDMWAEISTPSEKYKKVVEPLTNYTVARVQQDFMKGNTVLGAILTSTNRFIKADHLNTLNRAAYTGGIDFLHQWKEKAYYLDIKLTKSFIQGKSEAILDLQTSSARYYQRPDAKYVELDSSKTNLSGNGGSIRIGRGSRGNWRYNTGINWRSPGLELNDIGYMQIADIITQTNYLGYVVNKQGKHLRAYNLSLTQNNNWNFGGNYQTSFFQVDAGLTLKNNYGIRGNVQFRPSGFDDRILRGGPTMKTDEVIGTLLVAYSDYSKRFSMDCAYWYFTSDDYLSTDWGWAPGCSFRFTSAFRMAANFNFAYSFNNLQYVTEETFSNKKNYIIGELHKKDLGITFRADYIISPTLSIQFYGSPFVSLGRYGGLKKVENPKAKNFKDRATLLNYDYDKENNKIQIDDNNDNVIDAEIDNPDYNFEQFRSNFVIKWEYRAGSFLYLVWSHDRTSDEGSKYLLSEGFNEMSEASPKNLFLVKFNYWFSL